MGMEVEVEFDLALDLGRIMNQPLEIKSNSTIKVIKLNLKIPC